MRIAAHQSSFEFQNQYYKAGGQLRFQGNGAQGFASPQVFRFSLWSQAFYRNVS